MQIDIDRVSRVARIKITDSEREKYAKDLMTILKAFEIISKINTDNVPPSYLPIEIKNRTRKDNPKPPKGKELLSLTELTEDGYFVGPRAK